MIVVIALMVAANLGQMAAPLLIFLIPFIWIGFALAVKRLHDRNKSAWWLLIFYLLPSILEGVGKVADGVGIAFSFASIGLSIWALVELGFLRGTPGPNDYGPDPLATTA